MTAVTVRAPGGFVPSARVLANETGKGLALMWRRRATLGMATAALGVMYLAVEFFVGGGRIDQAVLAATLPGLFAYALAATAALQGSGGVAEEVNGGTMEQACLSPARPSLLVLGRLGALAAEGLIPAVLLAGALWAGFGLHYTVRPDVLVPLLLTMADALAYGLLMVALTMAVASIGAVVHVFNMAVMFFGGMFVPVTVFPRGAEIFAGFVPTTLGVKVLDTTLAGRGLGTAWAHGTLPWLLAHVAVLTALGWGTYLWTLRRARHEGGLSSR
jgi:ABC-2 type transport system permease protein